MDRAAVSASTPPAVLFKDGLGERRHIADPSGNDTLELLCLRSELSTVPSFEFALRERVSRLSNFRNPQFGRTRSVERMNDASLAMVSERPAGVRLSEMLINADQRRLGLDINSALCLIRQLVPAIAAFHEAAREAAHGAIGPERILITPDGRLVVMEYVLGAALEQLRFPREKYWSELRVALPSSAGLPRFDQRADVTQMGVVALSLILGRPMRDDEFPARVADVVASTWAVSPRGGFEPLPSGLRAWLGRALQLDSRTGFTSAIEARAELDRVVADAPDVVASQASLNAFLARYNGTPMVPGRPSLILQLPVAAQAAAPVAAGMPPSAPPIWTPPRGTKLAQQATPVGTERPPATPPRGTPVAPAASVATQANTAAPVQTPPRGTAPAAPPPAAVNPAAGATPALGTPRPPSAAAAAALTPALGTPRPPSAAAAAALTPALGTPRPPSAAGAAALTPALGTPRPPVAAPTPQGPAAPVAPFAAATIPPTVANAPTSSGTQYTSPASALTPPPPRTLPVPAPTAVGAGPVLQLQSMAESVAVRTTPPRGMPRPAPKPLSYDTQPVRAPQFVLEDDEDESPAKWKKLAGIAAALVVLVLAGAFLGRHYLMAAPTTDGTLVMSTNPAGAQVVVDGQPRGVTPVTLTLTAGMHKVELRGATGNKILPVSVAAGTQIAQYVELPHSATPASTGNGQLQVRTEPAGAKVTVDGAAKGTSPVTIADLTPGEHTVVLESDLGSIKQAVAIEAGATASLLVPLGAPEGAPVSGWVAVSSPVEMQLFEKDHLLGTSRTERIMVAAGRHEIDIVNDDLGYRQTRTLQVAAGKVAAVNVEMPSGSIAINAAPWAEVWIDGNKVGDTPIGNLSLPIGNHDVVFRHPDLGEQHHTATVTLKSVARLSVDLRKP